MGMARIDKDSYGTVGLSVLLCVGLCCLFLALIPLRPLAWALVTVAAAFTGFIVWFHRVPHRQRGGGASSVTAIADGKVVIIGKAFVPEYMERECIQVSVYMDFFDVHANFWPMDGEVTYYRYHPGKNKLAFLPKSSELNEHSSTALRGDFGEIFFRQIAGTFARRIVCYSKVGDRETAGEQMGIIKFGSRIDMFLPLDADIKVRVGDHTRACGTVIAELRPSLPR